MKARSQRYFIVCVAIVSSILISCSTLEMIEEKYEPEKGGVVKFDNSDSSRKEAQTLAQQFCRGPIKVQVEGSEWIPSQRPQVPLDNEESALDDDGETSAAKTDAPSVSPDSESMVKGSKDASVLYMKFRCAVQGRKAAN